MQESMPSEKRTALLAGADVKPGYYFSLDRLDLIAVGRRDAVLPGGEGERYLSMHTLAVLFLAPLLGAVFVALAPCVRIGLLAWQLGCRWLPVAGTAGKWLAGLVPSRKQKGR
jgi:hypothetical protein